MNLLKIIIIFFISAMCSIAYSLPQSFLTDQNKVAVWADFQSAHYQLNYDVITKSAYAISIIRLTNEEHGFPIIDFVSPASEILVNGIAVEHKEITLPNEKSKVKLILKKLKAGEHTIIIKTELNAGITFNNNSVENLFSYLDMQDRYFLERYLPSNFEYDNYKMTFDVSITGTEIQHRVFTNGKITETKRNTFHIEYPDYYTSSSLFFHLGPSRRFKVLEVSYRSIDKQRSIPITIYTNNKAFKDEDSLINNFLDRLLGTYGKSGLLPQLEKTYGPWPHNQLVLFVKNKLKGGMEYAGAAETSYGAFKHELIHNYFGRSVLPVDGNAGWIDEAIASWNDYKLLILADRQFYVLKNNWMKKNTNHHFKVKFYESKLKDEGLVNHDHYQRHTNKKSYRQGRYLVSYLDYLIKKQSKNQKNMQGFLRLFFEKHKMKKIDSYTFQDDIEEYSGLNFDEIFNKYIYKKKSD